MRWVSLWLPPIVWMAFIFALSSRHSVTVSSTYVLNFLFFKTLHVIEYTILYALFYRAKKHAAWAFFYTMLYAISDEFHQTMVPSREGRLRDVIIDGIGATCSWIILAQLLPKAPKKLRFLAKSWGFV